MSRLADRLAVVATAPLPRLREEWAAGLGGEAPVLPADLMRRMLAHRLQEKRHGGLPAAVERELARIAAGAGTDAAAAMPTSAIRPGARLVRDWQGRTIVVDVGDDGAFVSEGRRYRSLSRIAADVTGARWSGPRFFGVHGRG